MKICPYGGYCIDLGNPSDCEINKPFTNCANFSSVEEKKEFDSLPNVYFFRSKEGGEIGFENQKQLEFFLADLPESQKEGSSWRKI